MRKPDIEYGIHKKTSALTVWCNCKPNKKMCADCAEYFTDQLKRAFESAKEIEELKQRIAELEYRTVELEKRTAGMVKIGGVRL